MSFGGSLGICAARAIPESMTRAVQGPVVGNVSVDIAKIAIADIADVAEGLTNEDFKAISGETRGIWKVLGAMITLNLPSKSIKLPCIASGFGDGAYPASAL